MRTRHKKFFIALFGFIIVFAVGTAGYIFIENYSLLNAVYMTSITLGTVGYSEVVPLSDNGKLFTSILIFAGISVYIYSISNLTSFVVEGELKNYFKDVRKKKMIDKLKNHYIIVGYGRTGEKLVENFSNSNLPFLLIEKDKDAIERFSEKYPHDTLSILGDATEDSVLEIAGIQRAKSIMPVLSDDMANLFITMSSRLLNPDIKIITKVNEPMNTKKIKKAGANKILSSYDVTADRIYSTAIESNLLDFQDLIDIYKNGHELNLARVLITEKSRLLDIALNKAEIPKKIGLIIIGIERDNELLLNPKATMEIKFGDRLLVMGTLEQIKILESIC